MYSRSGTVNDHQNMNNNRHREIRLEKRHPDDEIDGVVAYLAPNFEVNPVLSNDLKTGDSLQRWPNNIIRDFRLITHEITVQGAFEHSEELPKSHRDDLEELFGKSPVTARDQIDRVLRYAKTHGGPFELYDGFDEYTATTGGNTDYQTGTFPTVQISEIRRPSTSGVSWTEYMIRMTVGVER